MSRTKNAVAGFAGSSGPGDARAVHPRHGPWGDLASQEENDRADPTAQCDGSHPDERRQGAARAARGARQGVRQPVPARAGARRQAARARHARDDAMRLIDEELVLDGIPMRNLATFVTTWMEPEAQRVIVENLHRNFIDHAEYPQTAEIEQRCIRMLADLFHAPGETTGARTQGSSEAIMLGALSLKWKWRERREKAGKDTDAAEPRLRRRRARRVGEVLPLLRRRAADHPAAARQVHDRARGRRAPPRREHDRRRGRAGHHVHRPRRRHPRHQRPARRGCATRTGSTSRCTSTGPAAASCGRSCTRTPSGTSGSSRSARSTSRATSSGSCTRASAGWCSASAPTSPRTSSSTRTTSARRDATFTLNFSTGSAMVLAQYYNFVRFGHDGLPLHHGDDAGRTPAALAERIAGDRASSG